MQRVGEGLKGHVATEGVYNHGELVEARMGGYVVEISNPQPFPLKSGDVPVEQVRRILGFI